MSDEELKAKYNLTDEALAEIKMRSAPPPKQTMIPIESGDSAFDGLPPNLMNAMKGGGEVSMMEMVFLMDYLDRKEERKEDRRRERELRGSAQPQAQDATAKLIEEMREQRHHVETENLKTRSYVETLLLGKKLEDTEKQVNEYRTAYKANNEYISTQEKESQALQYYAQKLEQIVGGASRLAPKQQTDFLTEVLADVGSEIKDKFKDNLIKAVRGEIPASSVAPGTGAIPKNYWDLAERALGVLEKYATRGPATQTPILRDIEPERLPPEQLAPLSTRPPTILTPIAPELTPTTPFSAPRPEEASYEKQEEPAIQATPGQILGATPRKNGDAPFQGLPMNSIGTPGEVIPEPRTPQKYISPTEALNVAQEMAKQVPVEPPPTPTEIPPEELKTPTAKLTDVKGIGPKWSSELTEAGIPDIQTLADTNPQDLADRLEIPLERAQDWIDQAKDLK